MARYIQFVDADATQEMVFSYGRKWRSAMANITRHETGNGGNSQVETQTSHSLNLHEKEIAWEGSVGGYSTEKSENEL